ncbi:MAG: HAMP domain-containing histidine kinase [Anaerolineae bacterium]|nr:HAMP domain-containing histidine kinase [Anaerolineae bacterium]
MAETPLHEARNLLTELRQNLDKMTLVSLRAMLTQVDELLAKADQSAADPVTAVAAPNTTAVSSPAAPNDELENLRDQIASFTSMMVHEIRKPMTSIRGYADMLAKGMIGSLTEMQQQSADTIRNNIMAMEGLVSDISDLNKLNAGRFRLDSKMTTFSQVVMEVQKQADALNAQFGHTLVWDVPQGLPLLTVDQRQLAKAIYKLFSNAIQYTPVSDGKAGTITLKAEALPENKLRVSVIDTGIGLTDEVKAKLGEPFFRGEDEIVISQKGYGMGIPVAMELLKLMNSKLAFEGKPGAGSTFSFELAGMG